MSKDNDTDHAFEILNSISVTLRTSAQEDATVRQQFEDLCWQIYRAGATQQAIADASGYSRSRIGAILRNYQAKSLGF